MSKNKKDNILFRATDPRGKKVELSQDRLDSHIRTKGGHLTDPEDIRNTIEDPEFILQDSGHIKRQDYYKINKTKKVFYNKVVVHFQSESEPGDVVTAFITSKAEPRNSEDVLWQKK